MAPDDTAVGGEGAAAETPPAKVPPAAGTPPPATVSMSQEDFDAALAKASARALADSRAETARGVAEAQARDAEALRRQAASRQPNAQMDALEAIDLRTDMLEEALAMHPDMPFEARQQLKEDLRTFRGIDQVRAAKDSGLHIKLADAAAGQSIRSGKYVPKTVSDSVQNLHREPAHTVTPSAPKIPDSYRAAVKADGLDLTEAELEQAYKYDSQNTRGW
jgi:hypothetical protein